MLSLFAFGLRSSDESDYNGIPTVIQSWTTNSDECSWFTPNPHDQVCDENGMYQRIDLRNTNLFGTIPSELSLLSNSLSESIQYSVHNTNYSKSYITWSVGLVAHVHYSYLFLCSCHIEWIYLSGNHISGTIPSELGLLKN